MLVMLRVYKGLAEDSLFYGFTKQLPHHFVFTINTKTISKYQSHSLKNSRFLWTCNQSKLLNPYKDKQLGLPNHVTNTTLTQFRVHL